MNPMNQIISYAGGAFSDRFTHSKAFGKITFTDNSLRFESPEGSVELPLDGLLLKSGGANKQMLFFNHPSVPEYFVFTSDHAVLKDSRLKRSVDIAQQIAHIQKAKQYVYAVAIAVILVIAAFVYGMFSIKEPVCIRIADRIPPKWEQKLGDSVFAQLRLQYHVIEDPEITRMLDDMTAPLLSKIPEKQYDFKLHIIETPVANAFALPGGHIAFTSGFLLDVKSSEEVAGVLAHEAAHVVLKHGLRQIIGSAGIYIAVQAFFGDASGLMAVLVDNGTLLLTRKYSRDYEREADEKGWSYLTHANINPCGMIDFFERLLEKKKELPQVSEKLEKTLSFLSTHPTTEERIGYLREKLDAIEPDTTYMTLDVNIEMLQEKIREISDTESDVEDK